MNENASLHMESVHHPQGNVNISQSEDEVVLKEMLPNVLEKWTFLSLAVT